MKKLLLLLPFMYAFQCEAPIDNEPNNCQCYKETIWLNNGIDTVLIESTEAPQYKCEQWGYGDEYLPIPKSEFLSRFHEICE